MRQLFANNATSKLAQDITVSDTSLPITAGTTSAFPFLSADNYFYVTLSSSDNTKMEIVQVTELYNDIMTVTRGAQGTVTYAFSAGDSVELRLTAGSLTEIVDLDILNNLISGFNKAYYSAYSECTYSSGVLTAIDIWMTNTKATHLFTKAFTYTSGDLTKIVIDDLVGGNRLTTTLTYSSGQLTSTTKVLS